MSLMQRKFARRAKKSGSKLATEAWWGKHKLKIYRVILFPIWFPVYLYDSYWHKVKCFIKRHKKPGLTRKEKRNIDKALLKIVPYYCKDVNTIVIAFDVKYNGSDFDRRLFENKNCVGKKLADFFSKNEINFRYFMEHYYIKGYSKMYLYDKATWEKFCSITGRELGYVHEAIAFYIA